MPRLDSENNKELPITKEHESYLLKMAFFWIASSISGAIVVFIAILYAKEIFNVLSENAVISVAYIASYVAWRVYRVESRSNIRYSPEFKNKMKSDITFAKRFNKTEILKTLISYFLYALPVFYASGMVKQILGYFGYSSGGFALDLQNIGFSIIASISSLAFGLLGSYLYDKIKHKLP
ncbi:MAG: hypothetical protein WAO71_08980 [Gallionella sp.]